MARILVKTEAGNCRLWCNTVDMWVTDLMKPEAMIDYLATEHWEPHTRKEAKERVTDRPTTARNQYRSYCYYDKKHRNG